MTELDLVDYTNTSHKISKTILGMPSKKKISRFKVAMANLLDFYMVFTIFSTINIFINFNLDRLIIAESMSFSSAFILKMSLGLPTLLISYYFFSFFFNHGQTFGMKTFKLRVVMPEQSIRDSFIYSLKNISFIMTCGISSRFFGANIVKEEDYLYSEFMVHKDIAPVDLLNEIERSKVQADPEVFEEYKIAA